MPDHTTPTWLAYARQVVEYTARGDDPNSINTLPNDTRAHHGVFVTLHKHGRLRGCMGILDPEQPLEEAVRHAAISAAARDPRFSPVTTAELADINIEVSILSSPYPMRSPDDLELGRHGIIVRRGLQRGLFLPQVAVTHHFDKETLLNRCCSEKAGLPADAWRDPDTEVLLFTTDVMQE